MSDKVSRVLEEISYLLKFKTKQVTAINLSSPTAIENLSHSITDLIKEESIPVLLYTAERELSRYIILLDTDPVWAFVCKNRSDRWDYMKEITELVEAYNGERRSS